ncbi:unnamed protein product [Lactuca virosa]|uniref:Uncharacterized protein n=1 Tax=Lactuca virosa TaxID=75947 RepID=A0AAU9LS85_9ASTR|nr:unnamed protein product [Lactuca virosa]
MISHNRSCSLTPPPHRPQPFVVAFLDSGFSSHRCSSHESLASAVVCILNHQKWKQMVFASTTKLVELKTCW